VGLIFGVGGGLLLICGVIFFVLRRRKYTFTSMRDEQTNLDDFPEQR